VETAGPSLICTAPLQINRTEALYAPARVCPRTAVLSAALFIHYPSSSYAVESGLRTPSAAVANMLSKYRARGNGLVMRET